MYLQLYVECIYLSRKRTEKAVQTTLVEITIVEQKTDVLINKTVKTPHNHSSELPKFTVE